MWFLLTAESPYGLLQQQMAQQNISGTYNQAQSSSKLKYIVRQDNLTEFLSKNGGNWTVERVQEWTPKVHLDNEKNKAIQSLAEPLSR